MAKLFTAGFRQFSAFFFCVILMCLSSILPAETNLLSLPMDEWSFQGKGYFMGRLDRRNLYQIIHPFEPAKAGDYGRIETRVRLPEGMKLPYTLRFYFSDNIYGENTGRVVDIRKGHRFNRILINETVAWSQDMYVNTPLSNPEYFMVDITPYVGDNRSFKLSCELRQMVDSATEMPGDLIKIERYATKKQFREKYASKSYWGDFAVYSGGIKEIDTAVPSWAPELKIKDAHLSYRTLPAEKEEKTLKIEEQQLLKGPWHWPVSQGIPLPMGSVSDISKITLMDHAGKPAGAEFTVLNRWPDGSLRWVLLNTSLPPGAEGSYRLQWGTRVSHPAAAIANPVKADREKYRMSNGLAGVNIIQKQGRPEHIEITDKKGSAAITRERPYMALGGKEFAAGWDNIRWLYNSPHRAELELNGRLTAPDGDSYGSCRLRIAMHANSPLIRLLYTVVNERTEPVPGTPSNSRPPTARINSYGLRLLADVEEFQNSEDGWLTVQTTGCSVAAAVRYFRHIWPIGTAGDKSGIDFRLFKPGDSRMSYYETCQGEAKTHEIWLAVAEKHTAAAETGHILAELVETPPRLATSELIRDSYVWGEMPFLKDDRYMEPYSLIVEKVLAPFYANTPLGIRHYGNTQGGLNFYWNGLHSMYNLYAMTGERKWYDWAERTIRHFMDICIIHWSPEGERNLAGAKNRTIGGPLTIPLVGQNSHPMFDHWNMTGDPDGLRLGKANADFVLTDETMVKTTNARADRQQGWPLMSMVRAWQETGDPRYGKHAKHIVDTALGYMEGRRGAYLRHHGSDTHYGIVPFMSGILGAGLRDYYLWTGDERAGTAVAQIAESIYAEMHEPYHSKTHPDIDYYYSPSPYYSGSQIPYGETMISKWNLSIVAAQAFSAYITDDPGLADIAWRSWRAYIQQGAAENDYGQPSYLYDMHAAPYWLSKAPVPDRTLDIKVASLWRHEAACREVWLNHKERAPLKLKVRWTVYEDPFHTGQQKHHWQEYIEKRGLHGELLLLDEKDDIAASVPLDFNNHPHGTSVNIQLPDASAGFYRLVTRGAESVPVLLVLQDIAPRTAGWGLPLDRGYIHKAEEIFFRVPQGQNELDITYNPLIPWHGLTITLLDETGRRIKEESSAGGGSAFNWNIKLPPGAGGKIWSIRYTGSSNILLRITGVDMGSPDKEALFAPGNVVANPHFKILPAPPKFSGSVINLSAGEALKVPRGTKTEGDRYSNLNLREGTIEFWIRVDASDENIVNMNFLEFGNMRLWHRGMSGLYWNLGRGYLQSGFVLLPKVWYHAAFTWNMETENGKKPVMNLYIDGVSIMGRMQTALPGYTGDWSGPELVIGGKEPLSIAGLRISSVNREDELKQGLLTPPDDTNTLYLH